MARTRRPEAATGADWPAELADADAPCWATKRAFGTFCEAQGVEPPHGADTPAQRRWRAIGAWAARWHPSPKWPAFPDQAWKNSSGLRAVEQAAARVARAEMMRGVS